MKGYLVIPEHTVNYITPKLTEAEWLSLAEGRKYETVPSKIIQIIDLDTMETLGFTIDGHTRQRIMEFDESGSHQEFERTYHGTKPY